MTDVHIIHVQSSTAKSPQKHKQVAVTLRFAGTLHLYRLACDWQCNACCLWASVQALLPLLLSKDFAAGSYKMCICAFSRTIGKPDRKCAPMSLARFLRQGKPSGVSLPQTSLKSCRCKSSEMTVVGSIWMADLLQDHQTAIFLA